MPRVTAGSTSRHPCDPREPDGTLWCGEDVALDFDYLEPLDLHEAVEALRTAEAEGAARIIAGGQSLLPALRSGAVRAARLISLRQIPELKTITLRDNVLSIGSEVTFSSFLESRYTEILPLLGHALYAVGNHTIRNRTTFGGTIAWSNPMAALLLALGILDATVVTTHRRLMSLDCIVGSFHNSFAADEIVVAVDVPVPRPSLRHGFHKTTARSSGGKALASMAVALDANGRQNRSLRIGVVGLRNRPWVSDWQVCEAGRPLGAEIDTLIATAPVEDPFDPLLPSPAYVKASARMVCRRLATELDHA